LKTSAATGDKTQENGEITKKDEEGKEGEKEKKKKSDVVVPPKDFDLNNLENLW